MRRQLTTGYIFIALLTLSAGALTGAPLTVVTGSVTVAESVGNSRDGNWREQAKRRIDECRKGNISITVKDMRGAPVERARVHVKMKKHAFPFGSMVNAKGYMSKGRYYDMYRRAIKDFGFNAVTQTIFWNELWNKADRDQQKAAHDLYKRAGYQVRGHTVIYPRWSNTPEEIKKLSNPDAQSAVARHIRDTATRMDGWYTDWDLVNEMYGHMDWINSMGGEGALAKWHRLSKETSPGTKVYYNHNGMISSTKNGGFRQKLFEMMKWMKEKQLIDGIGIEGHLNEDSPSPELMYTYLDKYSELGLPIRITEFDLGIKDRQQHASRFGDYLTLFFSHPNVVGVTLWGFVDGHMFQKRQGLITPQGELLPAGEVYKKLVLNEWWTDIIGSTDSKGKIQVRGFLGDYDVTTTVRGKTVHSSFSLTKDGVEVSVSLKDAKRTKR